MRHETHISFPLDIPGVRVLKMEIDEKGDYIITVESILEETTCRKCGRPISRFYGYDKEITLRHLPILGRRVYIRLRPKRYQCPDCDGKPTTTQKLDWYDARSPHTRAYDQHLLVQLINSTIEDVSRKEDVGYGAVEGAIERHISATVDWASFEELVIIGIDEIALSKGRYPYVAIISTQQVGGQVAILAVLPDRKKEKVCEFLESIPKRLYSSLKTVCTDMWDGYVYAVREFEQAHPELDLNIVIDRFHVAKNYRDAVDTVRKQELRRLKEELPAEEYEDVKGLMWACRKNNVDLTDEERAKLRRLFELAPDLKLAYTLREELTAIFDMPLTKDEARHRLNCWRKKVQRSGLTCFNKFLKTLKNWFDEIANYFLDRLNSGFVEGLNNKIKTIKRRCYGLFKVAHLFQRIYLDLEGYHRFA
jgi:transposase